MVQRRGGKQAPNAQTYEMTRSADMLRWRPLMDPIPDVTTRICLAVTLRVVILITYNQWRTRRSVVYVKRTVEAFSQHQ